jgi:hypothetical protein
MTNRSGHDDLQKWRDLVGGFILAFGDIELITYRLWSERFKKKRPPNRFAARTKQILSQLNSKKPKNAELRALLQEALASFDASQHRCTQSTSG